MTEHLRGRVRIIGYITLPMRWGSRPCRVFEWAVVNTRTGVVVASDNSCVSLETAVGEAEHLVGVCREVYTREIRLKELR